MASIYIILGAAGSGRREILADLIANGLDASAPVRVYHTGEFDDSTFPAPVETQHWGISEGTLSVDTPETAPETVFFVADGRANPVDQMEIFAALIPRLGWKVARVLTVVHCSLLDQHPELGDWFKACIHFSDAALLARREGVSNAWLKRFTDAHKEACNPCALELVKKGTVENPARILLPEARRLSMVFDDTDPLDEMEFDEENLPDEPFDLKSKPDPYFERIPNGARRIQIPDIARFIAP
ncbi:MAG: hypothetical protein LBV54_01730 [Puniceicoccales bacterium]|jgi:hypothetical protein|nr:hypothetical protein [Puniceicoccales bacterium]